MIRIKIRVVTRRVEKGKNPGQGTCEEMAVGKSWEEYAGTTTASDPAGTEGEVSGPVLSESISNLGKDLFWYEPPIFHFPVLFLFVISPSSLFKSSCIPVSRHSGLIKM